MRRGVRSRGFGRARRSGPRAVAAAVVLVLVLVVLAFMPASAGAQEPGFTDIEPGVRSGQLAAASSGTTAVVL